MLDALWPLCVGLKELGNDRYFSHIWAVGVGGRSRWNPEKKQSRASHSHRRASWMISLLSTHFSITSSVVGECGESVAWLIPVNHAEFDYCLLIFVQRNARFCTAGTVCLMAKMFLLQRNHWKRYGLKEVGGGLLLYRTIIRQAQIFSQEAPSALFSPLCSLLMTIWNWTLKYFWKRLPRLLSCFAMNKYKWM